MFTQPIEFNFSTQEEINEINSYTNISDLSDVSSAFEFLVKANNIYNNVIQKTKITEAGSSSSILFFMRGKISDKTKITGFHGKMKHGGDWGTGTDVLTVQKLAKDYINSVTAGNDVILNEQSIIAVLETIIRGKTKKEVMNSVEGKTTLAEINDAGAEFFTDDMVFTPELMKYIDEKINEKTNC
jgi:hypothetical protein